MCFSHSREDHQVSLKRVGLVLFEHNDRLMSGMRKRQIFAEAIKR